MRIEYTHKAVPVVVALNMHRFLRLSFVLCNIHEQSRPHLSLGIAGIHSFETPGRLLEMELISQAPRKDAKTPRS